MAKVSFTKLGLKANVDTKELEFNGQIIEIKQYLPINSKLEIASNVLNNSEDGNGFPNWGKIDMFLALEIIDYYTNITFTEKQKEDLEKLYDLMAGAGLVDKIVEAIPAEEYSKLRFMVNDTAVAFYNRQNSAIGIIEAITSDYSNLNLDASEIQKKLADPENLGLLRNVLDKLG